MSRRIGTAILVAAFAIAPAGASAFTLGETAAATGMQGTLAQGRASNVAGTINSVRNAVNGTAAEHNAQIEHAAQEAWNSKTGASRWSTNSKDGSGKGWSGGGSWQANGKAGGGWALASAEVGRGWSSGAWGANR